MEDLARRTLPALFSYEWTELALQEKLAGNTAVYIFPLCVLSVFLALAAQYESWTLPMAIILIVPMCLLSAIGGVWLRNMDNNIFTQIGLVALVGPSGGSPHVVREVLRRRSCLTPLRTTKKTAGAAYSTEQRSTRFAAQEQSTSTNTFCEYFS